MRLGQQTDQSLQLPQIGVWHISIHGLTNIGRAAKRTQIVGE